MTERKPRSARGGKASSPRVSRLWPDTDPDDWRDLRQVAREALEASRYEDNPSPDRNSWPGWAGGH